MSDLHGYAFYIFIIYLFIKIKNIENTKLLFFNKSFIPVNIFNTFTKTTSASTSFLYFIEKELQDTNDNNDFTTTLLYTDIVNKTTSIYRNSQFEDDHYDFLYFSNLEEIDKGQENKLNTTLNQYFTTSGIETLYSQRKNKIYTKHILKEIDFNTTRRYCVSCTNVDDKACSEPLHHMYILFLNFIFYVY